MTTTQTSAQAVLVAPGKDSGKPWDGVGELPPQVAAQLRRQARPLIAAAFRALVGSNPPALVVAAVPWMANVLNSAIEAPDVVVHIYVNGKHVVTAPKVQDAYVPTWATAYTPVLEIAEDDDIELRAVDVDLMQPDVIGTCTSRGMPWVNAETGYATERTFQCFGQLWGVALRVKPVRRAMPADDPEFRRSMEDFDRAMREAEKKAPATVSAPSPAQD